MKKLNPLPVPKDEQARLNAVFEYGILDSAYDKDLDELTEFASKLYNVPIVLITILDENRQWFKSNYGLGVHETHRSISFCQYTIMEKDVFVVEDAVEDERFKANPLVLGFPNIRFYAGSPLINEKGFSLGSLALIDSKPRKLTEEDKHNLQLLGKQVINFFELAVRKHELEKDKELLEKKVAERTQKVQKQIVELEKRDERLSSLNNELNRFIYKLSHDLLGPIKSLQGLTNLALQQVEPGEVKTYLELMKKTENKLDNTLISLIKLLSTQDPSELAVIDWHSLLEEAIAKAEKRVLGKKVSVSQVIAKSLSFRSDPVLLEIVLEEILVNSMQYNYQKEPAVTVSVEEMKGHILVGISDNGIGVREEEKNKIFEMFYKNEKSVGSGLGLYIVKTIIEKLGGSIRLETKRNAGTLIQLLMPKSL
ncbi:MAG: ATP-binding protein [Cytophagaceae bacterium]